MSLVGDVGKVMLRLVTILPEVLDLWDSVEQSDHMAITLRQAKLIRAMKDAQAREQIGAP